MTANNKDASQNLGQSPCPAPPLEHYARLAEQDRIVLRLQLYSKLSRTHDDVTLMTLRHGAKMLDSTRRVHGRFESSTAFACGRLRRRDRWRVAFGARIRGALESSIRKNVRNSQIPAGRWRGRRVLASRLQGASSGLHHHGRANADAIIEIGHILVQHPDAAIGGGRAD